MKSLLVLSFVFILMAACGQTQTEKSENAPVSAVELIKTEDMFLGIIELNRLESEIEAFEKKDAVSKYQSDLALFTGSSSIRFWSTLSEDMDPYPILNRGFGGSTLPEVNHYFDRIVAKYEPAQIFIYCGENDIAMGLTADQTYNEYVKFVGLVNEKLPDTDVFYISMKPSPSRWELWEQYKDANEKIKNLSMLSANLFYIDISEVMLTADGQPDSSIFIEDMLHMNASGYERWNDVIRPYVKAIRDRMDKK